MYLISFRMITTEVAEIRLTTEGEESMGQERWEEELHRGSECVETVKKMWLLCSVLTVSHPWCSVMTAQLCFTGVQLEETTT